MMLARRRITFTPTLDYLSSRIAPSAMAVSVTPPANSSADVTNLVPSQNAADPSQSDGPDNNSPSDDFDWTPNCAVEGNPPVDLP